MAEPPESRDVAKYVFATLGVLVAAAGAWVLLVLPGEAPPISYRTIAVELGDPERVRVTFEVTKEPGARAECQVTATGEARDVVNRLTGIVVPPADTATTRHVVTVVTDQPATDATVTYCAVTSRP